MEEFTYENSIFELNFQNFDRGESKKKIYFSPEELDTNKIQLKKISQIRGIILHQVIFIERIIDYLISAYFADTVDNILNLKNIILSKSQVTFSLKLKIFKDIMIDNELFDEVEDQSKLRGDLHKIMNIRDEFAHGEIIFDIHTKEPFLQYYRDGIKKKKITQEWLNEINSKIHNVYRLLNPLKMKMFKKYVAK